MKKISVALVGLGEVAHRIHVPACRAVAELELVAACDPDSDRRRSAAATFRIPQLFENDEKMLSDVSPQIVIVGAPPDTHFAITCRALRSGSHVLCEKPFMSSVDEADEVIRLAADRKLLLRVNNQYRYMNIYRRTKERLLRGEFGRLFYIQVWQQMFHPPSLEENWRSTLPRYLLYEFGTHALDLITYFFDALPLSVNMHMPRVLPECRSDVLVCGTMRFPDERVASLSLNRVSHAPEK
ncbi:MAG: Gfo/Idh/MocA family oxidoreductase, partial [Acidobacteriota bacterium]|nr:Gfo/Idh/MocA family oxidoreductase [Acidobacteriota bacterium]